MSTVAATNLKNASSSVNNAVTTSGGDLTNAAGVSFMSANKNLLYNGAMQVAQRGTSTASITTSGYYTADRWNATISSLGTWTQSVEADGPSGTGIRSSLKMLCTTAASSPAAASVAQVLQRLEGYDVQRTLKGTSAAQQLTMSFWVKSNVTGTYIVELYDEDNQHHVSGSYTISASATWEKKSITFPASTSGQFTNDNGLSLSVTFWLASGSNFTSGSSLQTTWTTSYVGTTRAVGQTNLAAATNNYWQVTGVQLEVGPVATSFEFKSYGQELRECQRYYYLLTSGTNKHVGVGGMINATYMDVGVTFPVTMRTAPSVVVASGTNYYAIYRNNASDYFNSLAMDFNGTNACSLVNNTEVSGTAGHFGVIYTNDAASSVAFSAEL